MALSFKISFPGLLVLGLLIISEVRSQAKTATEIQNIVNRLKSDIRGPYRDIRWFCTDGSIRQPKDPCPDEIGPGVQHARYKEEVISLAETNGIHFGQILAYTDPGAFWNEDDDHSRLKQYQLEKYLKSVDDGWILSKGQYYRGAVQAEDEEAWGIEFYKSLLLKDEVILKNYFLIRESLKDVPHNEDDNLGQIMRSQSKILSDSYVPFMELRIKIHGNPEASDINKVNQFKSAHSSKMNATQLNLLNELLNTLQEFHQPFKTEELQNYAENLKSKELKDAILTFSKNREFSENPRLLVIEVAELLLKLRNQLTEEKDPQSRLRLLDASLKLEEVLFKNASTWQTPDLKSVLEKICYLGMACAGAGYIELWEWESLNGDLSKYQTEVLSLEELNFILQRARSEVEWSAAMIKSEYEDVVETYLPFEPLASGFIDNKIRGAIPLHLGLAVGKLGTFIADESSLNNQVLDLQNTSTVRGLNPGFAFGELVVVGGIPDDIEVSQDKIYVFQRPPSDLKPVAGIATVAEGNLVSHVQLLARNLGIPNAALSDENLQQLKKYDGQRMFYAVSNQGNVILKHEAQMTPEEIGLFANKQRSEERIEVPVEEIRLDVQEVLDMRQVDADDSGNICGPKAANLGQLKKMFPDNVVEGLVIPFGIFKKHMEQNMSGQNMSFWQFLNRMFKDADQMRENGMSEKEVENYQLLQLEILRGAIKKMPLENQFITDLEQGFTQVLGNNLGEIPVFLRSDTNMEDLKDFTGAGLNLTLFNVREKQKILDGIRAVWASPYTERSFKWRQVYLLNPENVYPSILIIPSVDVDYSGVLITKGVVTDTPEDLTIAFSRGAGGAVDGQAAEAHILKANGTEILLAPAREKQFNRLPTIGGTEKNKATFEAPILNPQNLLSIRSIAQEIQEKVPKETGSDYTGAYDVELGFKDDRLWLFQIRPFVENKNARGSDYLKSITPMIDLKKKIPLHKTL